MHEPQKRTDQVTWGQGGRLALSSAHLVSLSLILIAYGAIGALYAVRTPAWQVPDEPAHYNYIRFLVEQRAFPVLQPGDYDQAYLERLKSERFPPGLPVDSVRYENHQPPLYYLLAAPLFAATAGNLVVLRLFSLALGAGVVLCAFLIVREIFPGHEVLALVSAGFVAFVPQHVAMMAGVNNDALAELLIGLGLWLTLRAHQRSPWTFEPWLLSLVLGAIFVTKTTAYPLAAIIGVMLLLKARRERWDMRRLLVIGLKVFVPACMLGVLWWGRNTAVYGWPDLLGLARHNAVVVGQLRTAQALAEWGPREYMRRFVQTTFQSFWGQFGWMGVVMDRRVYRALLAYSLLILVGCVGAGVKRWRARSLTREQAEAGVLLIVTLLLAAALYLYYNLTFVQFQGRYLYPALPVIGLGAALGIVQWVDWGLGILKALGSRLNLRVTIPQTASALALLAIALMAALDVFALYRFIIPSLALG